MRSLFLRDRVFCENKSATAYDMVAALLAWEES